MTNPREHKSETTEPGTTAAEAEEQDAHKDVAGAIEEDTLPGLQAELEEALQEVDKFRDMALRAEAEMQNVRRRAAQDVEKAHKFGVEGFVRDLLPVVDSLEKAIESAERAEGADESTIKAIIEGVGLCHKMLLDSLAKQGVSVVDPEGEPFDPNLHQAMSTVDNPDVEPNTVVTVVQKGYTLNERLVRPAMVMVSKA